MWVKAVALLRYHPTSCNFCTYILRPLSCKRRFDTSLGWFDNFCAPSVHLSIQLGHNAPHLSLEAIAKSDFRFAVFLQTCRRWVTSLVRAHHSQLLRSNVYWYREGSAFGNSARSAGRSKTRLLWQLKPGKRVQAQGCAPPAPLANHVAFSGIQSLRLT